MFYEILTKVRLFCIHLRFITNTDCVVEGKSHIYMVSCDIQRVFNLYSHVCEYMLIKNIYYLIKLF